jgi:hypothetical protein
MTACLLSVPPSHSTRKHTSCHVYSDSKLTTHTSMWRQAFIFSELYVQTSVVLSLSSRCKSVLKTVNYTFRKYIDMRLILGEACNNGAAAVRLYAQIFPTYTCFVSLIIASGRPVLLALLWQTAENGEVRGYVMRKDAYWDTQMEIPVTAFVEYKLRTRGANDSVAGSPGTADTPVPFARGTWFSPTLRILPVLPSTMWLTSLL